MPGYSMVTLYIEGVRKKLALTGRDIIFMPATSGRVCLLGFAMEVETDLLPES